MAQIHRLHIQDEAKNCSADQFYSFLKTERTKLPQVFPLGFKSVDILAGDGKSVGTVRLSKIAMGTPNVVTVTDKTEAVDDESRTLGFSVIDGDLLRMYTKFEYKLTVTPLVTQAGDKQSCLVEWFVEYEKENEDVLNPTEYVELASNITKTMGSHHDRMA
ncbi:hypothetical protein MKW98_001422 [Papaver atlanticum]|uniref:Bet v I/Major latex protein domain-containing protein n=1 Tax=Papaver atlanticum TaxID=357466 RepID=A0AAD4SXD0_9MAGN|nr:hypothetical protein MKW98_001422 [Papaver atlanticum]